MNFNKIAEASGVSKENVTKSEEIESIVKNNKKTAKVEIGKEGDIPRNGEKFTGVKYSKSGSIREKNHERILSKFLKEFTIPAIDTRLDDIEERLNDPDITDEEIERILDELNGTKDDLNDTEEKVSSIYEDTDMEFENEEELKENTDTSKKKLNEDKVNNNSILDDDGNTVNDLADLLEHTFGVKEVLNFLAKNSKLGYETYYSNEWKKYCLSKNVKGRGLPNIEDEEYASTIVSFAMEEVSSEVEERTKGKLKIAFSGRMGGHGIICNEEDNEIRYYLGYLFDFDLGIPLSTYDEKYGSQFVDLEDYTLDEILLNVNPTQNFIEIDKIWESTIDSLENEDFNTSDEE